MGVTDFLKRKDVADKIESVAKPFKVLDVVSKPLQKNVETFEGIRKFVGDVLQAAPRTVASVGIEPVAGITSLAKGKQVDAKYQPSGAVEKFFLGDKPIEGVFSRSKEASEVSKQLFTKLGVDQNKAQEMSLYSGPLAIGLMAGLDLTPLGGAKKTAQEAIEQTAARVTKYAGNINLDKVSSVEGVRELVSMVARDYKNQIAARTRGVVHNAELRDLPGYKGMSEEKLLQTKAGTALNAEEKLAAADILTTSANKLTKMSQDISSGNNSDVALLKYFDALEKHAAIQSIVSGAKAEAGRALQAEKILARQIPTEQKSIELMLEAIGGRDAAKKAQEAMAKIDPTDIEAVNRFIQNYSKSGAKDKVYWIWLNSILSNPITQVVNNVGNTMMTLSRPVVKAGEATIDVFKKPTMNKTYFNELPYWFQGAVAGMRDGLRRGLYTITRGMSPDQMNKLDVRNIPQIAGVTGRVVGFPTNMLSAGDEFFKAVNGTAELYSLAFRKAKELGKTGKELASTVAELVANPTEDILKLVDERKLLATFQQPLGETSKAFMQFRDKALRGNLKYIVPFVKTPTNIAKEAFRFSPLGFFNVLRKTVGGVKFNTSEELVKAGIGTAVVGWAGMEAFNGNLTGAAPRDKNKRDAFYREGKLPYSVKIGDEWYSYRRVEPISTILGFAADAVELYKEGKDPSDIAVRAAALIGRNLNDKTFMQGLSNVIEAISDPERYGKNFIETVASGYVPFSGAQSYVAQLMDPIIRDPNGVVERIKSRTPVLSKDVPEKLNVFGGEQSREGSVWFRAISPSQKSSVKNDPVTKELNSLGFYPGFPSSSVTIPKEIRDALGVDEENKKIEMTPKEYQAYMKQYGAEFKGMLQQLFTSAQYQALDEGDRTTVINNVANTLKQKYNTMFLLRVFQGKEPRIKVSKPIEQPKSVIPQNIIPRGTPIPGLK